MIEVDTVIEHAPWEAAGLPALAERAVTDALRHLGVAEAEVAVLGCDDARIAALNEAFRGKARATNVLSWPSEERAPDQPGAVPPPPGDPELGDIAIAWETTSREAEALGITLSDHATHLLVHGALHLLGYDHETEPDAARMEGLETEILAVMGIADPYCR